jgi:hypothetical protein
MQGIYSPLMSSLTCSSSFDCESRVCDIKSIKNFSESLCVCWLSFAFISISDILIHILSIQLTNLNYCKVDLDLVLVFTCTFSISVSVKTITIRSIRGVISISITSLTVFLAEIDRDWFYNNYLSLGYKM